MRSFKPAFHQLSININQSQVQKFYQERQNSKRQGHHSFHTTLSSLQNDGNKQNVHNNLYRRKSLMNRLKQESSLFTSFNGSFTEQNLVQKNTLNNSKRFNMIPDYINDRNGKNDRFEKSKLNAQNENYNKIFEDNQKSNLYEHNLIKRRSKSFQSQRFNSSKSQKNSRDKIPLSSILKKYQDQVKKIQKQINISTQNELVSKIQSKQEPMLYFTNAQRYQPKIVQQQTSKIINKSNLIQFQKEEIDSQHRIFTHPQIYKTHSSQVEKLAKYHQRADSKVSTLERQQQNQNNRYQLYENDLSTNEYKCRNISLQYKTETPASKIQNSFQEQQKYQPKKSILKEQIYNERIIQQQKEQIRQLQKQNDQYKKFVLSIKKMKQTLESNGFKNQELTKQNKEQQNSTQLNLKQLWRWIKTLPNSKKNNKQASTYSKNNSQFKNKQVSMNKPKETFSDKIRDKVLR